MNALQYYFNFNTFIDVEYVPSKQLLAKKNTFFLVNLPEAKAIAQHFQMSYRLSYSRYQYESSFT